MHGSSFFQIEPNKYDVIVVDPNLRMLDYYQFYRNKGDMGGYTTYLLPMSAMGGTLTGFAAPGAMLQNCEAIISPIEGSLKSYNT